MSRLGLAIVRRIVDAAGGRITCKPEPSAGTTVIVHLPRVPVPHAGASRPETGPPRAA